MFAFRMERFHMSESMTGKRIFAARTARRFPVILPMVARGELHLSGINQLGKHLTEENHRFVLARAKHRSSREIELLVAELSPRPDVPSRVRALPRSDRPVHATAASAGSVRADRDPAEQVQASRPSSAAAAKPARALGTFKPGSTRKPIAALAPGRFKIEITVDQNTHDRLRSLQDLLRQQLPSGDPAVIISRAIELLLDDTLKKKAAVNSGPRTGRKRSGERTRAIPAVVRREVWNRDGGRCAFVDEKGRRCRATSCIEYHHEAPFGKGGSHDTRNIALRCRAHNQHQADLDFGRAFMLSKRHGVEPHAARNAGHRPGG